MESVTENSDPESSEMATAAQQSSETLTFDERFEILKNTRRRLVLEHLAEVGGSVKLNTMADHVTAIENDTDVDAITSKERKRVYVGLYQFHLPKMADMSVINYDQDRGDITLTETGERLQRDHDQLTSPDRYWQVAYLALAGGGLLGVGLSVFVWMPVLFLSLLALQSLLLLVVTLTHAYTVERSLVSG